MSKAKVLSLAAGRARRRREAVGPPSLAEQVRRLKQELGQAREALRRTAGGAEGRGLLTTLARLAEAGLGVASWENLARLQRALYFAWHSEQVDEFGYDPRFAASVEPLLEFRGLKPEHPVAPKGKAGGAASNANNAK